VRKKALFLLWIFLYFCENAMPREGILRLRDRKYWPESLKKPLASDEIVFLYKAGIIPLNELESFDDFKNSI
jgi:hypothetical protein